MRRDLINAEIANLRDLLPLPPSTRQRLSQLQLMALICVYVRKANYFQQVFKRFDFSHHTPTPNIGFSKALSGFLMMMTQNGKLLYISDNAAEYLGHSMEDLLIHGDSIYDIIDKQDHQGVQGELCRTPADGEERLFLCRMNVSRNARRQMRFGDQKVVLVRGHFLSFLPLCSRNEPVFLASCTPIAMPETRECVVQGATNVFTTIHSMDMKIIHIDKNGEWHLGWEKGDLHGVSWYELLHWDCLRDAQTKHKLISQSEQDRSCILLLRVQRRSGEWINLHSVLQVKENMENTQQPVIVCTNQILNDCEAAVMRANPWLYQYYTAQSKLQFGLGYDPALVGEPPPSTGTVPPPVDVLNGIRQPLMTPHHIMLHHQNPHIGHMNFAYERLDPGPVDYSVSTIDERYHHLSPLDESMRHKTPVPTNARKKTKFTEEASEPKIRQISPCQSPAIIDTGGGTLMSLTHSTSRRVSTKNVNKPVSENAEFIDQWNPSPPWSETTLQKVPDLSHQELSPYVTTTPPTPSGTPLGVYSQGQNHASFTFDWSPEQYVPHGHYHVSPGTLDEGHSSSWPEHRLFPLQPPPVMRFPHPLQLMERSTAQPSETETLSAKSPKHEETPS